MPLRYLYTGDIKAIGPGIGEARPVEGPVWPGRLVLSKFSLETSSDVKLTSVMKVKMMQYILPLCLL
jgi:hypothetical protein